jgi:hypothetical protein
MMGSFMNSKVIGQVINFSISPLIGGGVKGAGVGFCGEVTIP